MEKTEPSTFSIRLSTIFWWLALAVTLFLIDDLVFGPAFWLLSALATQIAGELGRFLITSSAFATSFLFQLWLTRQGLRTLPNPRVERAINRLFGKRQLPQLEARVDSVKRQLASGTSAVALSLLVGGVFPVIFLHRRGMMSVERLRRLAVWTSAVYAVEFALIHGGYGLGGVLSWVLDIVAQG